MAKRSRNLGSVYKAPRIGGASRIGPRLKPLKPLFDLKPPILPKPEVSKKTIRVISSILTDGLAGLVLPWGLAVATATGTALKYFYAEEEELVLIPASFALLGIWLRQKHYALPKGFIEPVVETG